MKASSKKLFRQAGRVVLYPAVIVIPFALAVWLIIPGIHNRYKCELVKTMNFFPENKVEANYADFDNDGYSENFRTGIDDKGNLYCTIDNEMIAYRQYNLHGIFAAVTRHLTGDADHDGRPELFLFTANNDSLFIHILNAAQNEEQQLKTKFLTLLSDSKVKSWAIMKAIHEDLTGDGISEVIIIVNAGFQLKPRRVIAYDMVKDSVFMSPEIGAQVVNLISYHENGKPRLVVSTYASANFRDTIGQMHDNSAYFVVLDENLHFRFMPREAKGEFTDYMAFPFYHGSDTMLLTSVTHKNEKDSYYDVAINDLNGNTIHSVKIPFTEGKLMFFNVVTNSKGNSKLIWTTQADNISIYNHKLETEKISPLKIERPWYFYPDLDNDGRPELFFNSNNPGEMIITKEDLSSPVAFKIAANGYAYPVSLILRGNQNPYFHLQVNSTSYVFQYLRLSPLIEYSVLLLVYLLILGFTLLIRRIQKMQLRKKYETQQTISELKFMTIRNQMDPHFTFNVLNNIGSVILQNKPQESYSMLMKYSKLLRSSLASSDNMLRPLRDEIEFVTNYLEVQKLRFRDKLNYSITIQEEVDPLIMVPLMVIHTYVENSVKHGLPTLDGPGMIEIVITREQKYLCLKITDNGVGREITKTKTLESGKGHKIMHQLYSLLNDFNEQQITEEIRDLSYPDGSAAGTEVVILVPVGLRYRA